MGSFKIFSKFEPSGDQPIAIKSISDGLQDGLRFQTLLGATGTGKTYSIAKIIENLQRPTLVLAPNKILTAQLVAEFKEFFPNNAVEFFISYYDYYQPEAYIVGKDLFIEKDTAINKGIERLRYSTTKSLLTRRDVIVVASVSAIYGLGNPLEYKKLNLFIEKDQEISRKNIISLLIDMQYERNDMQISAGFFRVRGEVIDIWTSYDEYPFRVEMWGDEVENIYSFDPISGNKIKSESNIVIYPAKHYLANSDYLNTIVSNIENELNQRIEYFNAKNQYLEAQRIKERTLYDLEMLKIMGNCKGVENYSRYLDGRQAGECPYTLLDYFPDDFLTFIDESHISIAQIGGMLNSDRARKQSLINYGFRLPSAIDNRPLSLTEFLDKTGQIVFVSATPAEFEKNNSDNIVEQVIRPTGLVDPLITVLPIRGQIDDLLGKIRQRIQKNERVLIITLTKRMSESLSEYLLEQNIKACYLHSEIDSLERQVILRDLRLGKYDVLVGINLLREGLDLPEVSLVAVLDADKSGFLRSERSLIQIIGRAARNMNGEVVLYGDIITPAMKFAIDETNRRREKQLKYNQENNIIPRTINKEIRDVIRGEIKKDFKLSKENILEEITELESKMWEASENLDFEQALFLRDQIKKLEKLL